VSPALETDLAAEPLAAALVAAVAGLHGKAEMDGLPTTEISTGNNFTGREDRAGKCCDGHTDKSNASTE
jgi:hypothetical protein